MSRLSLGLGLAALLALGLPVLAQDPSSGSVDAVGPAVEDRPLRINVGPRASVTKLRRVSGDLVELIVRDTPAALDALVRMRNTPSIRAMDAVRTGGRTWFLRVGLRDPERDLQAVIEDDELILTVVERTERIRPIFTEAPTVEQLRSGEIPVQPLKPERRDLSPLPGDAISLAMQPESFQVLLSKSRDTTRTSWAAVDRARNAMLAATSVEQATSARYQLGQHYLGLGFGKEARYYFSEISKRPGPIAQRDLEVARARAALACSEWDEARDHLYEAWGLGANEVGIVEGLAVVSLATSDPPRAATARTLAARTDRAEARLLAAELLQRDGYIEESLPLLQNLLDQLDGTERSRAALRLGDAYDAARDGPAASRAWAETEPELAALREKLVQLLNGQADEWGAAIPSLVQASIPRSDSGAEALYLLAQIDDTAYAVTKEDAINDYAALMRRYPRKSKGSDVPEKFWDQYSSYVEDLAGANRWFDIAALHESVWDRNVRRAITDSRVLVDVSHAYEEVGLPDRAMVVLREAVAVLVGRGEDDPDLVFQLARLYSETGRWSDGLRSVRYLYANGFPEELTGPLLFLEGELHLGNEDTESALIALRKAALLPEFRDKATLLMAEVDADAGRCDRAAPTLRRLLFNPKGEDSVTAPEPWIALARCLRIAGDTAGAARAAKAAAERSTGEEETRYATWLAATASEWKDEVAVSTLTEGDDIWALMAAEQQASEAFADELQSRQETEWSKRK